MRTKHNQYDLSLVKPKPKGWVRFLHTADWHWGFSGTGSRFDEYSTVKINKTTEDGFNERMLDVQDAMEQIPQIAVACKVDFVLDAGDTWDASGYKRNYYNNVYTNVVHGFVDHGIPYVVILGNHNMPSDVTMGIHLSSIRRIPNVHAIYQGEYEQIKLSHFNTVIHAVPSPKEPSDIHHMLQEIKAVDGMINIGMAHTGVTTIPHYAHNSLNSVIVELDDLIRCKMDYFALGDFHNAKDLGHGIHYSGGIERFGFDEILYRPQVKIVDINPDTKERIVTPVYLDVRPMIDLPVLNCKDLDIDVMNEKIIQTLQSTDLKDKIVRFKLQYLSTDKKPYIDFTKQKELTKDTLYFEFAYPDKIDKLKQAHIELQTMSSLPEIWVKFAKTFECDPELQEIFINEGKEGLEVAIDELTIS